ncbi:hypothetical protein [Haloechinothrix salitolerans]|uniref:Uncharacterized protein n=1 Tax=Haloechinothrix salitolerans TaxID=926830 RepID=A0ABW2C1H0_9PSEU
MLSRSKARYRKAAAALAEYGSHRSDHQRLAVRCQHGHHLAFVYDTPSGLVYWAITGPHAHGSRDFVDTPHHAATRGKEYVDLLEAEPYADDEVPAWCDCGPRSLSRAALARAIADERRTIHLP